MASSESSSPVRTGKGERTVRHDPAKRYGLGPVLDHCGRILAGSTRSTDGSGQGETAVGQAPSAAFLAALGAAAALEQPIAPKFRELLLSHDPSRVGVARLPHRGAGVVVPTILETRAKRFLCGCELGRTQAEDLACSQHAPLDDEDDA